MDRENGLSGWRELQQEFQSRNERVVAELNQSWLDLKAILDRAASALEEPRLQNDSEQPGGLLELLFGAEADSRYFSLAEMLERRRPAQRAMAALTNYDAAIEDLLTSVPAVAELDPGDAFALAGFQRIPLWRRLRYARSHPKRRVRVRDCVRTGIYEANLRMSRAEGEFLLVIAQATLHVVAVWQVWRQASLNALVVGNTSGPDLTSAIDWWRARYLNLSAAAEAAGKSLANRSADALRQIQRSILQRPARQARLRRLANTRLSYLQYWSRLQRAVSTQVEVETKSLRLTRETLAETRRVGHSLEREHEELIAELDGVLSSVRNQPGDAANSFPSPHAHLVSAEERVEEWLRNVALQMRQRLPMTAESVSPQFALPSRRVRWRLIEPQAALWSAAQDYGRELLLIPLRDVETSHRAIVREIEHAREVFAFGLETSRSGDSESIEIATEAIANATALLEYQRRTIRNPRDVVAPGITMAAVRLFIEYHESLDRDRLTTLAKASQRRGFRVSARAVASFHSAVRWSARGIRKLFVETYRAALRQMGLLAPPPAKRETVEQMPALSSILLVTVGARELPAIYRRLFRLAPVEDPRFLIGRREELAGIDDAIGRWLSGQSAAVIVIGARGSGKTSLLNCAAQRFNPELETIRGQFGDRLVTGSEMETALCQILRVPAGEDLAAFLGERNRVVIIEEFERTFLRAIDGFGAVQRFIDLMQSTSSHVLWIVSTNEASYRFLRAACGVNQFFSHRINAMSVSREAMTAAILQRHNLSGLRLEFAPVPPSDPRVSSMKSFFGLTQESEHLFFDSLYRQCQGIYRSAFELWQDCIERVEGGTIHVAQPLAPEYDPLDRELNLEDCFALQAILQHGSLTSNELSLVLRLSAEGAHRRIQRMLELQILEPEPVGSGFRIKPQAGKVVRDALHRKNLL